MRRLHARAFLVLAMIGWLSPPAPIHAAPALPESPLRGDVSAVGEPLAVVLPRIGKEFQIRLTPGRELASQRVTLFLADAPVDLLARALKDLLSADEEAVVYWSRAGERSWTLGESVNRRRLAERLRDQDMVLLRKHLQSEIEWLRRDGHRAFAAAPQDPRRRLGIVKRFALASLMEFLGEAGRERLLAGEPFAVQIGQLPPTLRGPLREHVTGSAGQLVGRPQEELDRCSFALLLARTPTDPWGAQFIESRINPEGFLWARFSVLGLPQKQAIPFIMPPFRLSTLRETEKAEQPRRVSLNLTPVGDGKIRDQMVPRNLDQVLETVARECRLNIVADGYLRATRLFPANLQVKDYPLKRLLTALSRAWGCDWRFLDDQENTVLVRARGWWLEDTTDVPQAVVEEFRARLPSGRSPALGDLLRLAELSKAQVHKLVESGICPGALGVIMPGFYDESGVKPCLQFFSRLPAALQARAQSPSGLPLSEAPRALVETWLGTTLIANVGAITPEAQRDLIFSLRPGSSDPDAPEGFEVAIQSPRPRSTMWIRSIQPPRPGPAAAAPAPATQ